jgi:creatinine amidohydrolase
VTDLHPHVRIERLRPAQIRQALMQQPIVYMPLGTYEYHQEHLPIGLDALTAQGLCLEAAARMGGLVCPPLYYGTGGDHAAMPFTVMMPQTTEIEALLVHTLKSWQLEGVRLTVLMSGHFANEQVALVRDIAEHWNARQTGMQVLGLAMNMGQGIPMKPDHAGLFETTLLSAFWPDTVDLRALPPLVAGEDVDRGCSPYGAQRLDPAHPLWAIIGADPREFDPEQREPLKQAMVDWLCQRVAHALGQ